MVLEELVVLEEPEGQLAGVEVMGHPMTHLYQVMNKLLLMRARQSAHCLVGQLPNESLTGLLKE